MKLKATETILKLY